MARSRADEGFTVTYTERLRVDDMAGTDGFIRHGTGVFLAFVEDNSP
jgi:uncharacterized protein YaaQ